MFDLFDFHFRVFGKFSIHSNGSRAISPLCVCSTVFYEFAHLQDNYRVDKTARNTSKVSLNIFFSNDALDTPILEGEIEQQNIWGI